MIHQMQKQPILTTVSTWRQLAILVLLGTILMSVISATPTSVMLDNQQEQYWLQFADIDGNASKPITVTFPQKELIIEVGEQATLQFQLSGRFADPGVFLYFTYQEEPGDEVRSRQERPIIRDLADVAPPPSNRSATSPVTFTVQGLTAGHVIIGLNSSSPEFENRRDRFVRVRVVRSYYIDLLNYAVGILYVVCWSASYYPQTWLNYTRKSVVGFNFDFVSLNILGFFAYSMFNVGLYWVRPLQDMYYAQHPRGVIPVQLADCIFALHTFAITMVQGAQCIVYEAGGQRISIPGGLLLGGMIAFLSVSFLLVWVPSVGLTWLQYIYFASYVKLAVTLTKYTPQAYMNYRRKSTQGWSIGQIYLDFAGGLLSIGQMLLLAYNYSDWDSLTGDPTKFGLGVVSVAYDCLFFVQHYYLYGSNTGGMIEIPDGNESVVNNVPKDVDDTTRLL